MLTARTRTVLAIATLAMLLLAGCGSSSPTVTVTTPSPDSNHRYVPVSENEPVYSTERVGGPDDVVLWPSGAEYRGNTESSIPPVPYATATSGTIAITWRQEIAAKPGEIKYNIVKVFAGEAVTSAYLYADNAPSWLNLVARPTYVDKNSTWGPVVIMTFAPNAPVGENEVDFGFVINGVDYGTVPVKVTVEPLF